MTTVKIRSKVNDQVVEVTEDAAKELIDAGIYDPVDEPAATESTPTRGKRSR